MAFEKGRVLCGIGMDHLKQYKIRADGAPGYCLDAAGTCAVCLAERGNSKREKRQ
jgi:hypothetical protein